KEAERNPNVWRFQPRAETLPRRLRRRPADRQGRARERRRFRRSGSKDGGAERPRRCAFARARSRACRRRQALRSGEIQARVASLRRLRTPQGTSGEQRISQAAGQFPLALLRPVLRGTQSELLYVPAAHAERYPRALAIRRRRRSGRALRRRLCPCHHPRQPPGARDRGQERRRHGGGGGGSRAVLARPGGRQNSQRHRARHRRPAAAGTDPQELIDTRPYAREWHFHILNERALYGLPRKFNVGFDGGGIIPVLEDTNDIGFQAVEVKDGYEIAPGVWFRLIIGGITGHKD